MACTSRYAPFPYYVELVMTSLLRQMDTFAVTEGDHASDMTIEHKRRSGDLEDPEISADFKRPPY